LHVTLNPEFPRTAEGHELQGTEAQETDFRHLTFTKGSLTMCSAHERSSK